MHTVRRFVTTALLVIILAALGFIAWANTPAGPTAEAFAALKSTDVVKVSRDAQGRLLFEPVGSRNGLGLVFYPGARIDPRAYAPLAMGIAAQGTVVVITPVTLNLAVLSPERAQDIIDSYQGIRGWTVGGHSLGGTMAARFTLRHAAEIRGLVLWAACPSSADNLSALSIPVLSIGASRDGLTTTAEIMKAHSLLPSTTAYVTIDGGNHAQFGSYGSQLGDHSATIEPSRQWELIVEATAGFLDTVAKQLP